MPRPIGTTNRPPLVPLPQRDEVSIAVGALLAAVRVEAQVSQRQVADAMDTVQSHVSEMETGAAPPNVTTMIRFLVAVGAAKERKAAQQKART